MGMHPFLPLILWPTHLFLRMLCHCLTMMPQGLWKRVLLTLHLFAVLSHGCGSSFCICSQCSLENLNQDQALQHAGVQLQLQDEVARLKSQLKGNANRAKEFYVATGLSFTALLTNQGHIYTCGINTHGQLGHGDSVKSRPTPKIVGLLEGVGSVIQIASGPSYTLVVMNDGTIYSFGSGSNFCLGHGEQHNGSLPRVIQSFKRKNIHVVRGSAGDEHAIALDSNGFVSIYMGQRILRCARPGGEIDKTTPTQLNDMKGHLAVQLFSNKHGALSLSCSHQNRSRLCHDSLRGCLKPTRIIVDKT
ncbi:hypothetical protein MKX03_005384 [Papaver bracteatum]|nr:hypothetical protein MKX03_005384 [Papaver bracteatum]